LKKNKKNFYNKNLKKNQKKIYDKDQHSKLSSRANSKYGRKGLSSAKNRNKISPIFNQALTPVINLKDFKNKNFEKEANKNSEEKFFCERMFNNLTLSLIQCLKLKILDITLSSDINLEILSDSIYSFISSSNSIRKIKIITSCENEEFTVKEKLNYIKESIFEFKSIKINQKILDSAKLLITKNFHGFNSNDYYIIYRGAIKLFCVAFKSFKNLFFVNFLKELTLQNDEIVLKQAYILREIFEKASNLEHFTLKDLLLKCDFFDIVADKIHSNKQLRRIIFCNLGDIDEKSLNSFFKHLHCVI